MRILLSHLAGFQAPYVGYDHRMVQFGVSPRRTRERCEFRKYEEKGAYHYQATIGCKQWKEYDLRLAARYLTAVQMLDLSPGQTVLDAGSGEGVGAIYCCRRGAKVLALEFDGAACRLGKTIAQQEGYFGRQLMFVRGDLYATSVPDESVDAIISLEVIEHMESVDRYLRELRRVLKPEGKLVISTPLELGSGQLQDPYHFREYSAETLEQAISNIFARAEVRSCWTERTEAFYCSHRGPTIIRKLRRSIIRFLAFHGINVFVGPVSFDRQCPVLVASARK